MLQSLLWVELTDPLLKLSPTNSHKANETSILEEC